MPDALGLLKTAALPPIRDCLLEQTGLVGGVAILE